MKNRNRSTKFRTNNTKGDVEAQLDEAKAVDAPSPEPTPEPLPELDQMVEEMLDVDSIEAYSQSLEETLATSEEQDVPEADAPDVDAEADVDELEIEEPLDEGMSSFLPYGEPLDNAPEPEEFNELDAMQEILAREGEYGALPHPEIFNAYPPEVQRKIMEWTDRDVKARRDDESRRKDELVRATIERSRRKQSLPAIVAVVAVLCGAIVGLVTGNPVFTIAFLFVPIAVIVAVFVSDNISKNRGDNFRKPPKA